MKCKSITLSDLLLHRGMYSILGLNKVNLNEVVNCTVIFRNVKSFLSFDKGKIIIVLNSSYNEQKQNEDIIILLKYYFKQNGKN